MEIALILASKQVILFFVFAVKEPFHYLLVPATNSPPDSPFHFHYPSVLQSHGYSIINKSINRSSQTGDVRSLDYVFMSSVNDVRDAVIHNTD